LKPLVAIVAQGTMASGLAARLGQHGVRVRTLLSGRSSASQARAAAAGMQAASICELLEADILLSVLPPALAGKFAADLAPALRAAPNKPLYVDLNAISPASARSIAEVVRSAGATFVDGGIIGMPPKQDYAGPHLYVSGAGASPLLALREFGLDIRVLNGDVGDASGLKMAYAGITKGFTAVATAMILSATHARLAPALKSELAESEPVLYAALSRRIPDMLAKAYRWIDELRQIQQFATEGGAQGDLFGGAAQLYEQIARDFEGPRRDAQALRKFFAD
jgi:3-hydroxyisobutyrate dehydrogenase-like beta-hydroxyacid dehydrogenase